MPTIVSCPKCREQVTLPPEPYSGLICPHCQIEFAMQPVLRQQPQQGQYAALRQELAREVRPGRGTQRSLVGEVSLAEVSDRVIALPMRRSPGVLAVACHLIGLVSGGAMGLIVGYCLLTYWGGAHFNVLELPLPWLPIAAQPPGNEQAKSSQGTAARPGDAARSNAASRSAMPPSHANPPPNLVAPSVAGDPRPAAASHAGPPPSTTAAASTTQFVRAEQPMLGGAPSDGQGTQTLAHAAVNASLRVESHRPTPHDSTQCSLEELTQAATAARDALACPACKSTGFVTRSVGGRESSQRCPVCRGLGGPGITAEVYAKLCRLAEAATHADGSDPDVLKARQDLASVFRKAADRPEKQAAIGRHAAQRITAQTSDASDAKGILLVGTVERKERLGAYHAARVILLGEPAPVIVLSGTAVPFAPGERALIAGSIIADPTMELADYAGPRGPVVWGGMPLRLEE